MQGGHSWLSVRMAITASFGLIIVMLLISGIAVFLQQRQVVDTADTVLERNATANMLLRLDAELQRFAGAVTTFLLSKRPQDRSNAEAALEQVQRLISRLAAAPEFADSPMVERVRSGSQRLTEYQERLATLAVDDAANFPGLRYSNERMNPITAKILQYLDEVIRSADDLVAGGDREQQRIGAIARDARYTWATITSSLRGYLSFRSSSLLDNIRLLQEHFESHMAELADEQGNYSFEQEMAMSELQQLHGRFFRELDGLAELHGGESWRSDAALLRTEVGPLLDSLSADLRELAEQQSARLQQVSSGLVKALTALGWGLLVVGVVVSVVALAAGRFTGVRIMQLIEAIREAVDQSVAGNLTYRMDEGGRGEGPQIARLFNRLSASLQEVIGRFREAVDAVEKAVAETTVLAEQSTRRAEEQHRAVAGMARAVDTTNGTFGEITAHARDVADKSQRARTTAGNAAGLADTAQGAMSVLARETAAVAQGIAGLHKATESIGGMLSTIRAISEQTNLLALNAAIEAARAGEQGRGFAVVADEVRNLAGRAAEATGEIETLIAHLQQEATGAVRAIETATAQVEDNAEKVQQTATALLEIRDLNAEIDRMNSAIYRTVEEQQRVVAELSAGIGEVSESAEQMTAGAEQTARCAGRLGEMAKELGQVLQRFNT